MCSAHIVSGCVCCSTCSEQAPSNKGWRWKEQGHGCLNQLIPFHRKTLSWWLSWLTRAGPASLPRNSFAEKLTEENTLKGITIVTTTSSPADGTYSSTLLLCPRVCMTLSRIFSVYQAFNWWFMVFLRSQRDLCHWNHKAYFNDCRF